MAIFTSQPAKVRSRGTVVATDFGQSILKLVQGRGGLSLASNQAHLSQYDLDLRSCGVVVLPDQPGAIPHLLVASGKEGTVYLLNRDNMGPIQFSWRYPNCAGTTSAVGAMFSTPAYWNNQVYFAGDASPIHAFALIGGLLSTPAVA